MDEQHSEDLVVGSKNDPAERSSPVAEMLPCPFCGAPVADYLGYDSRPPEFFSVGCSICRAIGPACTSAVNAARWWNTRATAVSVGDDKSSAPQAE